MDFGVDREQWLFEAALALTTPGERESFLAQACADDSKLYARISNLLAAHGHSGSYFSDCIPSFVVAAAAPVSPEADGCQEEAGEMAGLQVGRYKLLRQLGAGGCGAVYLAGQTEPVRRRVAFKVIKLGMDTKNVIARFEEERQALALMDHPNIATVLDAGATESGRPYFVMELVQGVKITTYCDENRLDVGQRLKLFIQVCQAIQHAHQKGVIHRDIKPSNILVALRDGEPVPKVIDFGIAKAIAGRLTGETDFTMDGQMIGTPAYMSPEQAEMSGLGVDTRSDIYSLGVLLYELLTGRTPFDQKELVSGGLNEMRRKLREAEPPRLSTMLTSLAAADLMITAVQRQVEPSRLIKELKGDLDLIVMKALEKDRQQRYETANALRMDVERYLNNEPVMASPPSQLYRLRKLIQRNKIVYASGLVVAASLIVGLGISTNFYFKERAALVEAEQARASDLRLRQAAEAREKVTQASVLIRHGAMEEADALLESISATLLSPSIEATEAFRAAGMWNLYQRKWKQAAARFAILVQVNQVDKSDQTTSATLDLVVAAPMLLEAGDVAGYDHIRRMALERWGDTPDPDAAEQLIKISLLLPADGPIMKKMDPLAQQVATTLNSRDPSVYNGQVIFAWRAFALSLLEYRRGNFTAAVDALHQSLGYPDQSPACTAASHLLMSMACFQLGKGGEGAAELKLGRAMVEARFQKKLDYGDNQTGQILGWIMTPILLREAESRSKESIPVQLNDVE